MHKHAATTVPCGVDELDHVRHNAQHCARMPCGARLARMRRVCVSTANAPALIAEMQEAPSDSGAHIGLRPQQPRRKRSMQKRDTQSKCAAHARSCAGASSMWNERYVSLRRACSQMLVASLSVGMGAGLSPGGTSPVQCGRASARTAPLGSPRDAARLQATPCGCGQRRRGLSAKASGHVAAVQLTTCVIP